MYRGIVILILVLMFPQVGWSQTKELMNIREKLIAESN